MTPSQSTLIWIDGAFHFTQVMLRRVALALVFVVSFFVTVEVHALDEVQTYNIYNDVIERTLNATRNMDPGCVDCGSTLAGRSIETPQCAATHAKMFEKDVIDFRLAFGYMDYKADVEDRYAAAAFIEQITRRPCPRGVYMCEFRRTDNAELFEKEMYIDGRRKLIQLRVAHSSVTNNEHLNRNAYRAAQEAQTYRAERLFFDGIEKGADAVLYVGHYRNGGGPDFSPPKVNKKTRRTDYPHYERTQPGLKKIFRAIDRATNPPKLLGIYACNAEPFHGNVYRSNFPKTGLVLSGTKSFFDSQISQAYATLDSLLARRCEPEFSNAINSIPKVGELEVTPARVTNFFRGN